jgi:hypothetical protein
MPALEGTNKDPTAFTDILGHAEAINRGDGDTVEIIAEGLARWNALENTRIGQILSQLADPEIEHLEAILRRGVMEFEGMTPDQITLYQENIRGRLHVWRLIKYAPQLLEARLKELSEVEERRKALEEKNREALKKYA